MTAITDLPILALLNRAPTFSIIIDTVRREKKKTKKKQLEL
jgi:hypothetical protein